MEKIFNIMDICIPNNNVKALNKSFKTYYLYFMLNFFIYSNAGGLDVFPNLKILILEAL